MSPTLDRRRAIASLAGIGAAGIVSARTVAAQASPTHDVMPTAQGPGIIVTATGSASAPADHAIAQIILRAQYGPVPIEGDSPMEAPPVAPNVNEEDVAAVVAALVEEGVDESMILTSGTEGGFGGYFGQGAAVVVFQLDGEQIKTLANLLRVATETATELDLMFDSPGAMYLADTCEDLRAIAFKDSVDKGAEEATLIADALNRSLGELTQARKQSVSYGPAAYGYTMSDACEDLVNLGTAVRNYLPPFDATLPNEFTVYATVELTFSIV
jgi:uncharacterized protein YggE